MGVWSGSIYRFTATPSSGWTFDHFSYTYNGYSITTGSPDANGVGKLSVQVSDNENPTISVVAYFVQKSDYDPPSGPPNPYPDRPIDPTQKWYVGTSATPNGGGAVSGGNAYFDDGETCTLTATPAAGHRFGGWMSSNQELITEQTFSFMVRENLTFVAWFPEGNGMPLCDGTSGQIMFGSNGEILFDG
jgi:hypothetical protein